MKEYLLKEIANVKNGYAFDSSKYSDKGIPIIRIADIKDNIDLSKCVCIDEEINKEFLIKKGSLLIALSGATTGKMSVFSDNKIAYLNQRICSIYTKNEDISQEFLIYFLKSIQKKIMVNSYGGAQPNISSRWIENIKIKVPNIEIQKKISKKLELLANSINSRKSQLVFLKELTKSLFTTMFGDIKTNDKNWEIYYWKDVLNIKNGKNQKQVEDINGKYPIYGSGGIIGRSNAYICNENSIIIGRKGNINKPILVKEKFWNVDTAFGLEVKSEKMSYHYLYYFCLFYDFEIHNKAVTIPSLVKSDLEKIVLPVPPIELQNKFAERIEKITKLSFEIEEAIKEAENLYNSLISKYFD